MSTNNSIENNQEIEAIEDQENAVAAYSYATTCNDECCCDSCCDCGTDDTVDAEDLTVLVSEPVERALNVQNDETTASYSIGPNLNSIVDLHDGTLKFIMNDFAWEGMVMPVSINHLYTSAIKDTNFSDNNIVGLTITDTSKMRVGYGWRMNYTVSICWHTENRDGNDETVYTFVDHEGNVYRLYSTEDSNVYTDKNDAGVSVYLDNDVVKYIDTGSYQYYYEYDNDREKYCWYIYDTSTGETIEDMAMVIVELDSESRVSKVIDKNGREFVMGYTLNRLMYIEAPDKSRVRYTYDGNLLVRVTYPGGEYLSFRYNEADNHIIEAKICKENEAEYRMVFSHSHNKVTSVAEWGGPVIGRNLTYGYQDNNVTKVTAIDYDECGVEDNRIETTYLFDSAGELLDSYTNHYGYMLTNGIEDNFGISADGASISYERVTVNLLHGHSFNKAADLNRWIVNNGGCIVTLMDDEQYKDIPHEGKGCLYVVAHSNEVGSSIQQTRYLPAGDYTFSAYIRVAAANALAGEVVPGIYLSILGADGSGAESVKISDVGDGYFRLFASFTSKVVQNVTSKIVIDGNGAYYIDSAQLEQGSAPTEYNMIENGNFAQWEYSWDADGDSIGCVCYESIVDSFSGYMTVVKANHYRNMPYQEVKVKSYKNTRTTYTLSGFARFDAATATPDENVHFRLRACIRYVNGESNGDEPWQGEQFCADFSQETNEWQYASVTFTKSQYRTIEAIEVTCEYFDLTMPENDTTTHAYFDAVSLTVGETEYNLTEEDFAAYNSHEDDENTCDIEEENDTFEEIKGKYNISLSSTSFSDDSLGTIYSIERPDADYIGIEKVVDSRGNVTTYTRDKDTSRVTKVVDRTGTIKAYTYDKAGNITSVSEYDENTENESKVTYTYDAFNELKTITRSDGMQYNYEYNEFHKPRSIAVGKATPLVQYGYKNGSGTLKKMTYANGQYVEYTYDRFGRPIRETWKKASGTITQDTKYTYDGEGNPISVLDITNQIEYNYVYENGHLVCEMQSKGAIWDEARCFKTAGTLVRKIVYRYNSDNNIIERTLYDASGNVTEKYAYNDSGDSTVTLPTKAKVRSRSDDLGRHSFDEIQTGKGVISREFAYLEGSIPEEYKEKGKIVSSPTTQLVERISYSDGDELEYKYDAEERITSVVGKDTNNFVYDCHGQLICDDYIDSDGIIHFTEYTYDKVGNITEKKITHADGTVDTIRYGYSDDNWKDLLTSYNGQTIEYDASGNPTTYLGAAMTWTAGRKLSSYINSELEVYYTYNSLGQRIEKTVDGIKHIYIYDGMRLVKEFYTDADGVDHTLVFLYDAANSHIGIQHNGTAYYYKKNLQGDVIALLNEDGDSVAEYIYDAWGALRVSFDEDSIAYINPIRYRSYYYDNETSFYFLQSRYYDSVVGRFINADDVETVSCFSNVIDANLFAYCQNDPVSNTDATGSMLEQKLAEIFLSAVFGMVFQLFMDLALYLARKIFYGDKTEFSAEPGDYVEQALSWAIDCLNPFSKKKRIIAEFVVSVILSVINQIVNLIAGLGFDIRSILEDTAAAAVSSAISHFCSKKAAREISKLKKSHFKNRKELNMARKEIRARYSILGKKINMAIEIPSNIWGFVEKVVAK